MAALINRVCSKHGSQARGDIGFSPKGRAQLRQARKVYFRENQFGANGGYGEAWVDFNFGPVPFPFPNTPPRVRAVKQALAVISPSG